MYFLIKKNISLLQHVLCGPTDQDRLLGPDALANERLYLDAVRLHLQGREQIHLLAHPQHSPRHGDITADLLYILYKRVLLFSEIFLNDYGNFLQILYMQMLNLFDIFSIL